jgi:hypothetical protein
MDIGGWLRGLGLERDYVIHDIARPAVRITGLRSLFFLAIKKKGGVQPEGIAESRATTPVTGRRPGNSRRA